jgi:hypothetical protein
MFTQAFIFISAPVQGACNWHWLPCRQSSENISTLYFTNTNHISMVFSTLAHTGVKSPTAEAEEGALKPTVVEKSVF